MKYIISLVSTFLLLILPTIHTATAATQMILITSTGFLPNKLTFTAGEKVQLIINNTDQAVHNVVIPDLNVKVPDLMKGEMAVSNFTVNKTGTYTFFSNTPGYKELHYNGTLIVKENKTS